MYASNEVLHLGIISLLLQLYHHFTSSIFWWFKWQVGRLVKDFIIFNQQRLGRTKWKCVSLFYWLRGLFFFFKKKIVFKAGREGGCSPSMTYIVHYLYYFLCWWQPYGGEGFFYLFPYIWNVWQVQWRDSNVFYLYFKMLLV
jgi:hypothetical protein